MQKQLREIIEKKQWEKLTQLRPRRYLQSMRWTDEQCEQMIYISLARAMPVDLLLQLAEGRTVVRSTNILVFMANRYCWMEQYRLMEFLHHTDSEIDALIAKTKPTQAIFRSSAAQLMLERYRRVKTTWRVIWLKERSRLRVPLGLLREIAEYW